MYKDLLAREIFGEVCNNFSCAQQSVKYHVLPYSLLQAVEVCMQNKDYMC